APYVDLVMGPDGYRRLPEALAKLGAAQPAGQGETAAAAMRSHIERAAAGGETAGSTTSASSATTPTSAAPAPGRRALRALPVLGAASASDAPRAGDGRLAILDFEASENYEG